MTLTKTGLMRHALLVNKHMEVLLWKKFLL